MRLLITKLFALAIVGLPMIAVGDPMITYEIGAPASSIPGFSASWLHQASGCPATAGNTQDTVYRCGSPVVSITGSITGSLGADGILTGIMGSLTETGGGVHIITGGRLGGAFVDPTVTGTPTLDDLLWYIDIDTLGRFYFETMGTGGSGPNQFSPESFVLWGQNADAYNIASDCVPQEGIDGQGTYTDCGDRRGIDLYGMQTSVPEPATVVLFGLGLLGMGWARQREALKAG